MTGQVQRRADLEGRSLLKFYALYYARAVCMYYSAAALTRRSMSDIFSCAFCHDQADGHDLLPLVLGNATTRDYNF